MLRLPYVVPVLALAPPAAADDSFPIVPDDLEVALYARDPLVRNPCAITFDARGRLCVGMGPQYRNPKPDTPGDSVWILVDRDRDGLADSRTEFATGFNSIQGLAWNGDQLWVANAPDLTVVRDTDGDEVADEYLRLYTDLGNLEHGLHGLNVGPDGWIYMSKGNSKGLTRPPDRVAPKPFRELWGADTGAQATPPRRSGADDYRKNYHDPADDWGLTGGVLRCGEDGSKLEIVARGFRNPWDIAFDDGFDWLGTDNDQTQGDKIFAPFFGAHFGWGHPWSYDWKGDGHLPTVPSSGPLFEGSGTGVVYLAGEGFPGNYSGIWLVNDWLRRETYIFRPEWKGAHLAPAGGGYRAEVFAHAGGGRSMGRSGGRAYDPTDIEIGPDGAVYVASWGRVYGARYEEGKLANEGRIYRIRAKVAPDIRRDKPGRAGSVAERGVRDLLADLTGHLPARRIEAQRELLRRDSKELRGLLADELVPGKASQRHQTWAAWTYGRLAPRDRSIDKRLVEFAGSEPSANLRIQALRILAHRARLRGEPSLPDGLEKLLGDPDARIRHAAVLAAHEAGDKRWTGALVELCAAEQDRIVYYSAWRALQELMPRIERRRVLETDNRPAVRRGLVLGLLEEDAIEEEQLRSLAKVDDKVIAGLAARRLGGRAQTEIRGRPLLAGAAGRAAPPEPVRARAPMVNSVAAVTSSTGAPYRVAALEPGVPAYTDRPYRIREVPAELRGAAFVQTANNDADAEEGITVRVELRYPSTVYLADDARAEALPAWARDGWQSTSWTLATDDPRRMRLFKRELPAGELVLGTNRDGVRARKGNYLVIVAPKLIDPPTEPTTPAQARALLGQADADRGRDLFFARWGSACTNCHRLDGVGNEHAPDLAEIGSRADAAFIIESILRPNAAITEGFSAVTLKLDSGKGIAGVIIEETGRQVTIALSGGETVTVERGEIAERVKSQVSAMPAGYDNILRPRQVADLTAYLLTRKSAAPEGAALPGGEFSFKRDGERALELHLGSTRLATFLMAHGHLTRRAFVNVQTPSGIRVTRAFPAPEGSDHLHMHPGIWLAYGWIDGNDYWRFGSKVVFDRFLAEPRVEDGSASFSTRNRYLDKAGENIVCIEDASYRFSLLPGGVLLDIDASWFNDERGFAFGDQEESGLAVRVAQDLSVQSGSGAIVNDSGGRDGAGTWGREFRWIDYSGIQGDKRVGLLVLPHPDNPRPSWAHSRDYGVLVANPFPKQPRERREPYVKTPVAKGERFRLRYRVLIHEGPAEGFDAAALAERAGY